MRYLILSCLMLNCLNSIISTSPFTGLSYPELYMLLGTLSGMTGGAVLANRIVEEREEEEEEECK